MENNRHTHCEVHDEFMVQVALLTNNIAWLRKLSGWAVTLLVALFFALGGSIFAMTSQITAVNATVSGNKEVLVRHVENSKIHYKGEKDGN